MRKSLAFLGLFTASCGQNSDEPAIEPEKQTAVQKADVLRDAQPIHREPIEEWPELANTEYYKCVLKGAASSAPRDQMTIAQAQEITQGCRSLLDEAVHSLVPGIASGEVRLHGLLPDEAKDKVTAEQSVRWAGRHIENIAQRQISNEALPLPVS